MAFISENLIKITSLHKYFNDNHILKGLELEIKKGELLSIIGRSGCGKTTLLRCMNCLEIPDKGSIEIDGITLDRDKCDEKKKQDNMIREIMNKIAYVIPDKKLSSRRHSELDEKACLVRSRVGMLFQGLNLFPHLSVLENVRVAPLIVKGENKKDASDNAFDLLRKVGMERFADRYPTEISGGQAQRVAIARALAMNPMVMLYDEPTSALDPELIGELTEVMKNLHEEGMTQVIVTHAIDFAKNISDRVAYMESGQIIETGSAETIFSNPRDKRTRDYLNIRVDI